MPEVLNIALVEDNRGDAEIIKELVSQTGIDYQITWLKDGQQAVDYFAAGNEVDFVLLDLKLPKLSGLDVMAYLKRKGDKELSSVIVLTGSTSPLDMSNVRDEGVTCYLIKPMTIEEMDRTKEELKEIFEKRRSCGGRA